MKNPCKGCGDNGIHGEYIGCHSNCTKYLDWRDEYRKEQELIRKKRALQGALNYVGNRNYRGK